MADKKNKKKKSVWRKTILIGLICVFVIDIAVFESVVVTDTRMENTLFPGDVVIVNELAYGKRLPITLLTLPFFREHLPFTSLPSYLEWVMLPYTRIQGYSEIKRSDLLAINYPLDFDKPTDKKTMVIKRCIGLPGDTVAVSDKKVFVNRELVAAVPASKFRYRIVSKQPLSEEYLQQQRIFEGGMVLDPNVYDFYITHAQADSLRTDTLIKNVNIMKIPRNMESTLFFPSSSFYAWNLDYFGDIIVPAKGVTVALTVETLPLYQLVINYYEGNEVYTQNNQVFLNGEECTQYTFKNDYYFVMDDNRDNSKDSRIWGFVPESHIAGKPVTVAFTVSKGHNSWWSRFFMKIE